MEALIPLMSNFFICLHSYCFLWFSLHFIYHYTTNCYHKLMFFATPISLSETMASARYIAYYSKQAWRLWSLLWAIFSSASAYCLQNGFSWFSLRFFINTYHYTPHHYCKLMFFATPISLSETMAFVCYIVYCSSKHGHGRLQWI